MSRRAALTALRPLAHSRPFPRSPFLRTFSTPSTQPPPTPSSSSSKSKSKPSELPSTPYEVSQPPQFPPPNDPFTPAPAPQSPQEYSETTKTLVRGVARLMGYNTRASTAIRESGRMVRGIVESIERDRAFWYDECALPPTYQTFFQLHLLYILILLPRLRALPATTASTEHPIPEPLDPGAPGTSPASSNPVQQSSSSPASSGSGSGSGGGTAVLSKPLYESYPTEVLQHFFELAESEMRQVLGRGERERVVRKYMDEMGEQWRGAGAGLDYVLGLTVSEEIAERQKADSELASWVWRNLLGSRGLTASPEGEAQSEETMTENIELVVRFVRREMARLDGISDADVINGNIGEWGNPKPAP